jgi:acetyl-CoA synthetase
MAELDRLKRFLRPRHVAIIGGDWSAEVVRQCKKFGFTGQIWPVNPTRTHMAGVPCFASLDDLPEAPDAVFVGVNRQRTIQTVAALNAMGAGGVVCFASGFAETGDDGKDLQVELIRAAGDMALAGPNCYGILNYLDGVALWPDQHGGQRVTSGVAILSQSGNIGLNLTMQQRDVPMAYMITLGNQAVTDVAQFIDAMLDDPRIKAIGILIEGLKDVAAFSRAAIRALAVGVPIIALKSGTSPDGAAITISHTATLSGPDHIYNALFERLGIYRCFDLPGFLEALKYISLAGPLDGNKIVSMSCSGGEAAMVADSTAGLDLDFADFTSNQKLAIRATLTDLVSISNPFDYHTFIWGNGDAMEATYDAVMQGDYNVTMLLLDYPKPGVCDCADWDIAARAFAKAAKRAAERTGARAVVVSILPESIPEKTRRWLIDHNIVPLQGLNEALRALACAAWIGQAQRRALPRLAPSVHPALETTTHILNEYDSKNALAAHGLAIPHGKLVSAEQAPGVAQQLGFPVVLKIIGDQISHKTEVGGVALNLANAEAVSQAASDMAHLGDTFLIEKMVGDCVAELIIGVQYDPQFGPVMVVGAGGIFVELLHDSRTLLLPLDREQVSRVIESLRVAKLLRGYRGRPVGDMAAAIDAVMAVARYVEANSDGVRELDVNPLMVLESGAVAVDVLIKQVK